MTDQPRQPSPKQGAPRRTGKKDGAKTPDVPPEELRTIGQVVVQNEFYRDGYRLCLRIAVLQCFIIFALIGAMFFVIAAYQPENRYFATTEDGRLIPMVALSQPNMSDSAMVGWVAEAAIDTMTFGYKDYRKRLQDSSVYFTPAGWESFTRALASSNYIERIEQESIMIDATLASAPRLLSEKVVDGRYQWTFSVELSLNLAATRRSTGRNSETRDVRVEVVRVPRLENPNGVGIASWQFE